MLRFAASRAPAGVGSGRILGRVSDEESVLLLFDPPQELGDGGDGARLGHQRAEAGVQLELTRDLQRGGREIVCMEASQFNTTDAAITRNPGGLQTAAQLPLLLCSHWCLISVIRNCQLQHEH